LITEVDLQRTRDEFYENVKFATPASIDEALVAAAKLGDHQAVLELWTRHSSRAFKATYRITGNREDPEDAIQDAWMKAYLHLTTFDGRAQFTTWLTRIAINSPLMILRRKRARPVTSIDIGDGDTSQWEIADRTKSVEELYTGQERVERLSRSMPSLLSW
jgi:RNA polymerase sigma-70 factor, ECF subfamily